MSPVFDQSELVAEKIEGRVEVADADHRVEVTHDAGTIASGPAPTRSETEPV
jgi:hypothetical protein